jgi:hypothetical protein
MTALNAQLGQALKARGQQIALDYSGDWADRVVAEFRVWLDLQRSRGLTFVTVEEFRSQATAQPASHQGWGSLPRLAMKAGLIAPKWAAPGIQDRAPAASPRTHGHDVKRWLILETRA